MAHLTILSPLAPYPPHAGGTAHTLAVARQLARYYQLSLYALARQPEAVHWGPLAGICQEVGAFRPTPQQQLSFDPPAIRQQYSAELTAHLATRWHHTPPDVVQIEMTSMAQYAPLARAVGARTVCTAQIVAFLAQVRRARREPDWRLRLRRWVGALSLWQYERRVLRQCDLVVTLSQQDARALQRWLPGVPVVFVPAGIDLAEWPACFNAAVADAVLFVGNYAHPPNLEAATWLARQVWPLVRQAHPHAQLTLAGRAPPPAVLALATNGILVPGTQPALQPLYASHSLAVAPIFWGGGVRIKIIEALANGLPLVTTRMAAEGVALEDGRNALFAETPAAFAAAIIRLLDDAALRQRLGHAGRTLVEQSHDWRQIGRRLVGLYNGLVVGKR